MLVKQMQQQGLLGEKVTIFLKNGREVTGTLVLLAVDHLTIETTNSSLTIGIDIIGGWEIFREAPVPGDELNVSDSAPAPVTSRPVEISSVSIPREQGYDERPKGIRQPETDAPPPISNEVLHKLIEIEARLTGVTATAGASLKVQRPDFAFPVSEIPGENRSEALRIWNRIADKFNYAERVNELSISFGRITPVIFGLRQLVADYPTSSAIWRHLGYSLHIGGKQEEALTAFLEAALRSPEGLDWLNCAALTFRSDQMELTCSCLYRHFEYHDLSADRDAWYAFLHLLHRLDLSPALVQLSQARGGSFLADDEQHVLESAVFLLTIRDRDLATDIVRQWHEGGSFGTLIHAALPRLDGSVSESFKAALSAVRRSGTALAAELPSAAVTSGGLKRSEQFGYVRLFKADKGYGFLAPERGGADHFFHRSAITDDDLLRRIERDSETDIRVLFEATEGPRGPIATRVSMIRTVDERFELAVACANEGEYAKAIEQLKLVLAIQPDYPEGGVLLERWREYARATYIPKGSSYYARAKRAHVVEKDADKAIQMFRAAIANGDNVESAIKDLAMLLVQHNRALEAVTVVEQYRDKIRERLSFDNLLITTVYPKAKMFDQAIEMLNDRLRTAKQPARRAQIVTQIAGIRFQQGNYQAAEQQFREVVKLGFDTRATYRSIAYCLIKQERYTDAEQVLNHILTTGFDPQTTELLQAVAKVKETGNAARLDDIVLETNLTGFTGELSAFARFFIDRCQYEYVNAARVNARTFDRSDIQQLENWVARTAMRNPSARASAYLSAAKIISEIQDWDEPDQFYRYLGRSFASSGDAAVYAGRPLDAVREWYCEAMAAYDGARMSKGDEQDAVNALVRYLYSLLGTSQVPVNTTSTIDEALDRVVSSVSDRTRIFHAIATASRSRYAATRLLERIYPKSSLRTLALDYLAAGGVRVPSGTVTQETFVRLWNQLLLRKVEEARSIDTELRLLANVDLTTVSLENSIRELVSLNQWTLSGLDQQRLQHVRLIFEKALDLCNEMSSYDTRARYCREIDARCQDFIQETVASPTKLSVERLESIVTNIHGKVKRRQQEIDESSLPQLTLSMPREAYTPKDNGRFEIQFQVTNKAGCSPADSVTIILTDPDEEYFSFEETEIQISSALPGGRDPITTKMPIQVTEKAMEAQAFSLSAYVQYKTLSGEPKQTAVANFSIRLAFESEFEAFDNPYLPKKAEVIEEAMFYGRAELIEQMTRMICNTGEQGTCFLVYGQKRVGKSSVRVHLRRKLEAETDLLILDISNIQPALDESAQTPAMHRLLWRILRELPAAIECRVRSGAQPLDFTIPNDIQFFTHPDPLLVFEETFEKLRQCSNFAAGWDRLRVLVLLDEFGYVFEQIVDRKLPEDFMKTWKALLQKRLFNAVLIGPDVMRKFKLAYANEFGTTQDVRVTYLQPEDAALLADEPIRRGGRAGTTRYTERRALDRILDLTANSPFYIQILCYHLVEYMNHEVRQPTITWSDVESVKERLIRGIQALSKEDFDNLYSSGDKSRDAISREDTWAVLSEIAVNSRTGHPCNRNSISVQTLTPVDRILDDLVEREVIDRHEGHYYRIRVKLFEEWLIAHQ